MAQLNWISFSHVGGAQGICVVEGDTPEEALDNAQSKDLVPDYDHIQLYLIDKLDPGIEKDKFYTAEELREMGYLSVNEQKKIN